MSETRLLGGLMTPVEIQRHLIAFNVIHGGLGDYGTRADGKRDDDGVIGQRTRDAAAAFARAYGKVGTDALREAVAALPDDATLGMRALAVALREWCAGVCEEPPGSNRGPRIAEYFAVCERDGRAVTMTAGEWCAASASWCTKMALREGERAPHGFRIGGAELEGDLKRGAYSGRWVSIDDVRVGRYTPRPGDLVVLARPGAQAWARHICRVVALRGSTLWTLGGNERNTWRLTPRRLSDTDLRGFGAYPA